MTNTTLQLAHHMLGALGYDDALIQTEYPVWLGRARGTQFADIVAFGRPEPRDMSTATITVVMGATGEAFDLAQALASPYMLLEGQEGLDLWVAESRGPRIWRENLVLADAPKFAEWLKPTAALRSKVGLRQLPLFDIPVNLLANARDTSADRLGPIVTDALEQASEALDQKTTSRNIFVRQEQHKKAAQLVVSSLITLVLRDRYGWSRESATDLLARAASQFPTAYKWLPNSTKKDRQVFASLIEGLGRGIDYASFDPVILSQVYGEALVTDDDRKKLGIHYTPPRLAQKILEYMPVELIEPESRDVLDPACGSGNLLVAAHDRLRELQPADWNLSQQHSDLAVRLHGIDIDPFAVEIAENALFLHANPAGNGWQIQARDTLKIDPRPIRTSIIVTNPPWRYTSNEGKRHQAASDFLIWSISALRPGGLLGIILPQAWLNANYSDILRREVQSSMDIFEIWRLPVTLFESSHAASCMLIGRKRDQLGGNGSRVIREVHSEDLDQFLKTSIAKATYVIKDTSDDLGKTIEFPEPHVEVQKLDSLAVIRSGPQPKPDIRNRKSGTFFLNRFRDVRPYAEVQKDYLWKVNFPEDFQAARGSAIIDKKKVLVSAARTGADTWRLRVSLDKIGVATRNSMRGIAPNDQGDDALLYALNIIVGSGFATSFAASYGFDRNVPARVLPELPIPVDRRWIERLGEFGLAATTHATAGNTAALQETLMGAEAEVWAAYGYSEGEQAMLTQRLEGEAAPEGKPRYPQRHIAHEPNYGFRRYGCVLEADGYSLKVWVNGVTPPDGIRVNLPDHMPGWLVRPGATFDAYGIEDDADLTAATYRLQSEAWTDLDLDNEVPRPLLDIESLQRFAL